MGNIVVLFGKCGKDPEIKEVGGKGTKIATFSLATSKKVGDQWMTEWHNIKCWRSVAEKAAQKLRKGDTVALLGESTTEKWEKDGKTIYRSYIVVNFASDLVIEPKEPAGDCQPSPSEELCPF